MDKYRSFAVELAYEAGRTIRKNFSLGTEKEWKDDQSPLTATDLRVNKLVVETIEKEFPEHDVLGEELSSKQRSAEFVWVCDPIDGTVPFSHGYPTSVFSLALTKNGNSVLGVIYDPFLDRLAVAEKEKGAYMNDEKIQVSKTDTLKNSLINLDTDLRLFQLREKVIEDAYCATLYSAVYASMLVACGEFVAEIYDYINPWDGAAAKIIVEEAGGKVTDIFGNNQRYDQNINGFIASNGLLHSRLVKLAKQSLKEEDFSIE